MLLAILATAATFAAQEPILIDCDPGQFTDDNVAITMLSRTKKFRIAGVTVVAGNVWANEGLRNARATMRLLGEKVPVHLGAQQPLVHTLEMSKKEGKLEFAGAFEMPRPRAETETAVDFIISTLEKQPMTVLAIGPLTNIAKALAKKPSIAGQIKRLVIMGGAVHVPGNASKAAEFNFWFDPEAARDVLRSPIAEKILFGLDACNHATYGKKEFDIIAGGSNAFTKLYREHFGFNFPGFLKDAKAQGYLWDELAAAYLIDPSIVSGSEAEFLDVETTFGPEYGKVKVVKEGSAKTRVILNIHHDSTISMYLALLR